MTALAPLLVALGLLALGARLLRLSGSRATGAAAFAAATTLGLAASALVLALPLVLTGRVLFGPLVVLHLACVLAEAPAALAALRRNPRLGSRPALLAGALAGFVFLHVVVQQPFYSYDAKAIYGLKAKALLHERDLDGPVFQDVDVVHYHADYPLGLPLLMAYIGWLAEGDPTDPTGLVAGANAQEWIGRHDAIHAYMPLTLLWVAAFLAMVVGAAQRIAVASRGLLVPVTLLVVPMATVAPFDLAASWRATAELPLTLCLGLVALTLLEERGARRAGRWGACGVLAQASAGALLLKQDAVLGLGCLLLACALLGPTGERARRAGAIVAGAVLAVLVLATLRAATAGAPFEEDYLAALASFDLGGWISRLPHLPFAVGESLARAQALSFWGFTMLVALPWAARRGRGTRFLALVVLLHLAAVLLVFLVTPNHLHWHVRTALPRLWSQLAVPACVLSACCVTSLLTRARDEQRAGRRPGAAAPAARPRP